jgi:hypothetical protein
MLKFALYDEDAPRRSRRARIDPAAMVSIEGAERRPAFGGWHQIAVIAMVNGDDFVVEDEARRAARMIREA